MTSSVNGSVTPQGREGSASLMQVAADLRWWLLGIVLACTGVSVAAAFLMRPVYRAEVVLLPVSQEGDMNMLASMASQLGVLGSIAGLDLGSDSIKERAIATLSSRSFTMDFIREKDLIQRIFEDDWDASRSAWTVDEEDIPTLWEAQKEFDEEIRDVIENRRTGLVTLAIEWRDRDEAAQWANELVDRVNQRIRREAIEEAQNSLAYLNKELEKTQAVEIRAAIFKLAENQARRIMLANVREDYAFQVIDKATAPDDDDFVRPQRVVLIVAGFIAGLALSLVVVLSAASLRRRSEG